MKSLYESLLTGKVTKPSAKVQPRSRSELKQIIDGYIEEIKPHPEQEVDLNWIDISRVDDLSFLFQNTDYIPVIDKWKIDHVKSFTCMFAGNKCITRSPLPVLQKKLLVKECYNRMFGGCSSLIEPPELPAMELTKWCYYMMFCGCTSLKHAPQLPATVLAESCYSAMFHGCTSLTEPPELPAKELAPSCYWNMFANCTALKKQAKTPKNTLVYHPDCVQDMYEGCPNIK